MAKERIERVVGDHQRENCWPIGTEPYLPDGLPKGGATVMDSEENHPRERSRSGAAHRTSRHPMRSTILAGIAAALATIALVLTTSGNPAQAASSLANGNLETGDLTGWSVDTTNGGDASVVDRYVYYNNPACEYDCSRIIPPHEGSYFALLTSAGQPPQLTSISQPFEASNGDKVSGWAFFHTYRNYFDLSHGAGDETAQVVITNDSGTTVATPFEDRASWNDNGGTSGWQYWEHTFTGLTGTGQFRIEARLRIPGPYNCAWSFETGCSVMGLDDVKTSIAGPDTWPPETYITSGPRDVETSTSATYEFYSNEQGSTFECQLSKQGTVVQQWDDCASPKSYSNLSRDTQWRTAYYFKVRATDPAGNVDPTPAVPLLGNRSGHYGAHSHKHRAQSRRNRSCSHNRRNGNLLRGDDGLLHNHSRHHLQALQEGLHHPDSRPGKLL